MRNAYQENPARLQAGAAPIRPQKAAGGEYQAASGETEAEGLDRLPRPHKSPENGGLVGGQRVAPGKDQPALVGGLCICGQVDPGQ